MGNHCVSVFRSSELLEGPRWVIAKDSILTHRTTLILCMVLVKVWAPLSMNHLGTEEVK